VKVYRDSQRRAFARRIQPTLNLKTEIDLALNRTLISRYFFEQWAEDVREALDKYWITQARVRGVGPPRPTPSARSLSLDIQEAKSIPELANEIAAIQTRLAPIAVDLETDIRTATSAANGLANLQPVPGSLLPVSFVRDEKLGQISDTSIQPWLEARVCLSLAGKPFEHRLDRLKARYQVILDVMSRMERISLIDFWLDVAAPLFVAGGTIIYVSWVK
jgi:hypothetical protein